MMIEMYRQYRRILKVTLNKVTHVEYNWGICLARSTSPECPNA